jgi:hypothetical protein
MGRVDEKDNSWKLKLPVERVSFVYYYAIYVKE